MKLTYLKAKIRDMKIMKKMIMKVKNLQTLLKIIFKQKLKQDISVANVVIRMQKNII